MGAVSDGRLRDQKNARELFQQLKQEGVLPEAAPDEEFARAIAILASGGFLFLENL